MATDIWEQAVEIYLTLDRGLFLNPQYLVGSPGEWKSDIDFLAISFPENTVWMVEVTKSPESKLFGKIDAFESDYVPRIKEQLLTHGVVRGDDPWSVWTIGLWVFAPDVTLPRLESCLLSSGAQRWRTVSLEKTPFPDWDERFR